MQFSYTAKSSSGELQAGEIDARTVEDVKSQLRAQNLFPIDISRRGGSSPLALFDRTRSKRGIGRRDLLSVTTQLAVMTKSGIDLASALKSLAKQSHNPKLRSVLAQVHEDVTGGKSVSEALRAQQHIFGEAYVASVAAGEAAGKLPAVLNRLAQMQRAELRNRSTMRTLLAYPILLTTVSSAVVMGLMIFVLPQFKEIFSQFDIALPKMTQGLMALSSFLRYKYYIWGPVVGAAMALVVVSRATPAGRRWWDGLLLNTAVLRNVSRAFYVGRTFRMLGLMIDSGVPLLEGLRLTRNSVRNLLYRDLFDRLEDDILNGRGLAASMIGAGFIPPVAAEMVMTAEKTGTLGTVTELMGEHYEEEGEAKLRELATMVEPLIIVVMGTIVAAVVMAVMFPMFEIATLGN